SIQRENSSMTSFTRETVMADTRRVTRFTLRLRNHLGTVLATAALLALLWLGVVTPAMDRAGALGAQQPPPPTRTTLPDDTPVIGPGQPSASPGPGARFTFKIDPKTPLADLLPTPPKSLLQPRLRLIDDPAQAPELAFQEPLHKGKALAATAHQ